VFFKDSKQLLGLGHYQNRPYRAAVTHLHLVCFAYALLTHIAIDSSCAQEKHTKQAHESTSVLQNRLRCIVWEDTAQYLKDLPDEKSVFKELSRLLIAA
jgi:SRSO17 transposase